MTRTSNLGTFLATMAMAVMMLVFALVVLGPGLSTGGTITIAQPQEQKKSSPPKQWIKEWITGQQTPIREGMTPDTHLRKNLRSGKHTQEEIDLVYKTFLEGRCVASATFCGGPKEYLHLCVLPELGTIGGLWQINNEIHAAHDSSHYWDLWTPTWRVCDDWEFFGWIDVFAN